jgi:hypothetical protein
MQKHERVGNVNCSAQNGIFAPEIALEFSSQPQPTAPA